MKDEEPIEVEEFEVFGHKMRIRHFAPRYDSIGSIERSQPPRRSSIRFADGTTFTVPDGTGLSEQIGSAKPTGNRHERRAAARLPRRRRGDIG